MKTREQIEEMVKNPIKFMPYDRYQVGMIELYPFVPLDMVPEKLKEKLSDEIKNSWNPEEEMGKFNLVEVVKDETEFLTKLLNEMEDLAAIYRFPRLLANLWLGEALTTDIEKRYKRIVTTRMTRDKARRDLRRLIRDIVKQNIKD